MCTLTVLGERAVASQAEVSLLIIIDILMLYCLCSTSEGDQLIPTEDRTTTPYMTKYERARVLGTRALQIR